MNHTKQEREKKKMISVQVFIAKFGRYYLYYLSERERTNEIRRERSMCKGSDL